MEYLAGKEGLEAEFSHMVKVHAQNLHLLALRVTKCEQLAKDVVQDVFLKLWEHRNQFHQIENIEAWLYRVTENKLIDHLRKTAADKRLKEISWSRIRATNNETEQRLTARESRELISRAIENLPAQRKIIYRLNREQLLSYRQIAEELQISPHTVKNQLSSALHYLRSCLKSIRLF
ncbi:MAG TPA: RNA polymerase sigma-70 factor [Puia sp.]|jgi:RNA polymerase sigma-70 factor (ECF subfamily)